jgi:hypothetical protein
VPGEDGPWIDKVIGIAQSLPAPPTLVLAVDGSMDAKRPRRLRRWLVQDEVSEEGDLRDLPALYDRLAALGGPIHIIHRPTGEAIAGLQIEQLRA